MENDNQSATAHTWSLLLWILINMQQKYFAVQFFLKCIFKQFVHVACRIVGMLVQARLIVVTC